MNGARNRLAALTAVMSAAAGVAAPAPGQSAPSAVTIEVPPLPPVRSVEGFEFVSFQFNVSLAPFADPGNETDYLANVLANYTENFTYLRRVPCTIRYCTSRTTERVPGRNYSSNYRQVTRPPGQLIVRFHFAADHVAGRPLSFTVHDGGSHTLSLTADSGNLPVTPGTPLAKGSYTLTFTTDSLPASVILTIADGATVP